jgi:hypothetical protein
LKV